MTAVPAGAGAASPTDGIDIERTASVLARLLPLLRRLKEPPCPAQAPVITSDPSGASNNIVYKICYRMRHETNSRR